MGVTLREARHQPPWPRPPSTTWSGLLSALNRMAPHGAYQFRQKPKHGYAKPPVPIATAMAKPPSDNQAPMVPPTATLASNQKIQIVRLSMGAPPSRRGGGRPSLPWH
jgi:hypothetical protein